MRALKRLASRHARRDGQTTISRGDFARLTGAAIAGSLVPVFSAPAARASAGRVAIVGAGIAGLTTALRLHDAGITSTVYESSARIGGRMHSEWSYWNDGQHTEWCGAMIDSDHHTILGLAKRFGLALGDSIAALPAGARDTAFLDGHYYPMSDADRDFAAIYPILQKQLASIGATTTYDNATAQARRLDAMSMAAWIDTYVPGGANSRLGSMIADAYRNEYGRETSEQSCLNLVYMLGIQKHYGPHGGQINVLGYSDQRYFIANGNQRLPIAIANALPSGTVQFNHRLSAIRRTSGGRYELTFDVAGKPVRDLVDRVVLAIPFIILRNIDYSGAGFDAAKSHAIQELGYGYHTKLHTQYHGRPWQGRGPWPSPTTGQIWTTLRFQNSIDFTLGQAGSSGIIERFTGAGPSMLDTPPAAYSRIEDSDVVRRDVREFFAMLDEIWPGVSKHWNGKATFGNAQADPNIQASYSCWLVNQYTTIAGIERLRQGNVHFAGEHCSIDNQGFMEGGAETGMRAAGEILADVGIKQT
jgi:monoamine oxidase